MPRGSYRSFARMNTDMTGRCSSTGRYTAFADRDPAGTLEPIFFWKLAVLLIVL